MSSRFWKNIIAYLREFLIIFPPQYFILINNSGIYCLRVQRKKTDLIQSRKSELNPDNIKAELELFFKDLKHNPRYLGQPMYILIGGTFSFYYLKDPANSKEVDIISLLSPEDSRIAYRPLKISKDRYVQLFFGINVKILENIRNVIYASSFLVEDIIALPYHILKTAVNKGDKENVCLEFPGEILELGFSTYPSIATNNKTLSLTKSTPGNSDKEKPVYKIVSKTNSISKFLYPKLFQKKFSKSAFRVDDKSRPSKVLMTLSGSLRLSAIILFMAAIISILSSFVLGMAKKPYTKLLSEYDVQLEQVSLLKNKYNSLERELDKFEGLGSANSSFSGIIASFCQRRPNHLVLSQIDIFKDNSGNWNLNASGETRSENSVLAYRGYVLENLGPLPLEIAQLVKTSQSRSRNSDQTTIYTFKLSSRLSSGQGR